MCVVPNRRTHQHVVLGGEPLVIDGREKFMGALPSLFDIGCDLLLQFHGGLAEAPQTNPARLAAASKSPAVDHRFVLLCGSESVLRLRRDYQYAKTARRLQQKVNSCPLLSLPEH